MNPFRICRLADQNNIYQSLEVAYDADSISTNSAAQFSEGGPDGNPLDMTGRCNVKHNGVTLSQSSDGEGRKTLAYWTESESLVSGHDFVFTNADGKTFENSVDSIPITEFKSVPATISKSADLTVEWTGPAVQSADKVCIEILAGAPVFDDIIQVACTGTPGATTVTMKSAQISKFTTGEPATLQFYRELFVPMKQTTAAGGSFSIRIRSKKGDSRLVN